MEHKLCIKFKVYVSFFIHIFTLNEYECKDMEVILVVVSSEGMPSFK